MKNRRLVYIAAPYSPPASWSKLLRMLFGWLAVWWHTRLALQAARQVAKAGGFPITPHQIGRNIENIGDYLFWIAGTLDLALRCDAIYAVPGWEKSKGAVGEIRAADRDRLPVFYSLDELKKWCRGERVGLLSDCEYPLHAILARAPQTLNLRNVNTNEVMEVRAWRVQEGDLDPERYTFRSRGGLFAVYRASTGELVYQTEE